MAVDNNQAEVWMKDDREVIKISKQAHREMKIYLAHHSGSIVEFASEAILEKIKKEKSKKK